MFIVFHVSTEVKNDKIKLYDKSKLNEKMSTLYRTNT